MGCAAIAQIVAVDRGDDDMAEPHLRRGDRGMLGLERIDRARLFSTMLLVLKAPP
jgi:hypothetical protein